MDVGVFEVRDTPAESGRLSTYPYSVRHHDSRQIQQLPFCQNRLYLICADCQAESFAGSQEQLSIFINGSRTDKLGILLSEQSCSIDFLISGFTTSI